MHRNWMKSITRLVDALTTPGFGRPSWPPKPVKPLKPTTRGESPRRVRPTPTQGTFVREQFLYEPESPAVVARQRAPGHTSASGIADARGAAAPDTAR